MQFHPKTTTLIRYGLISVSIVVAGLFVAQCKQTSTAASSSDSSPAPTRAPSQSSQENLARCTSALKLADFNKIGDPKAYVLAKESDAIVARRIVFVGNNRITLDKDIVNQNFSK